MRELIRRIGFVVLPLALTASFATEAAHYPSQPIRIIVPFAPAGASDFVARIMQGSRAQFRRQPVVIDNRAGAAGNIGRPHARQRTATLSFSAMSARSPSIRRYFPGCISSQRRIL